MDVAVVADDERVEVDHRYRPRLVHFAHLADVVVGALETGLLGAECDERDVVGQLFVLQTGRDFEHRADTRSVVVGALCQRDTS